MIATTVRYKMLMRSPGKQRTESVSSLGIVCMIPRNKVSDDGTCLGNAEESNEESRCSI